MAQDDDQPEQELRPKPGNPKKPGWVKKLIGDPDPEAAKEFARARRAAGFTQARLAYEIGYSLSMVTAVEQCRAEIPDTMLEKAKEAIRRRGEELELERRLPEPPPPPTQHEHDLGESPTRRQGRRSHWPGCPIDRMVSSCPIECRYGISAGDGCYAAGLLQPYIDRQQAYLAARQHYRRWRNSLGPFRF